MSAASYMPDEESFQHPAVHPKQSFTGAEYDADNFLDSQPFSRASPRGGSYGRGHSEVPDDDLIAAAQCGDQLAFAELCRRHSSIVKNKILRIVRNREDAEDALQDTLLRAYLHLSSFRRSCKFATWLTAIGVNSALMIMRKRKVRRESNGAAGNLDTRTLELLEPVDRSPGPEGICVRQQAILLVRREVEKLRPSLRSIVDQYYRSECSLEEVANTLDISVAAAKARLQRGRVRLRSSLARYGMSKARS